MKVAITGAFSYSGLYIARRLLQRGDQVINLTGHPSRSDPFGGAVAIAPLNFDDAVQLRGSLTGANVLVNTYWIRFDRGRNTQRQAVENTRRLLVAAREAGISRIVHISITNPSPTSNLPYFSGKASNEDAVRRSDLTYAILRPTVLFGNGDVLINNIAYFMRRLPFFLMPGSGNYGIQPVHVDDLAALAEEAVHRSDSYTQDTVGPETFTFLELLDLIARTLDRNPAIIRVPPPLALAGAKVLGLVLGDVVLTSDEVKGLMADLLMSSQPPLGKTALSTWLQQNRASVGRRYASELDRHYR